MKLIFKNKPYPVPSLNLIIKYQGYRNKNYLINDFFEVLEKSQIKIEKNISADDLLKKTSSLEVFNYCELSDTKKTIFNTLKAGFLKNNEINRAGADILAKFNFREDEVISQFKEVLDLERKDEITYHDINVFHYYFNPLHKFCNTWRDNILNQVQLSEENSLIEKYYIIQNIFRHYTAPKDLIAEKLSRFSFENKLEAIFWIMMGDRIKYMNISYLKNLIDFQGSFKTEEGEIQEIVSLNIANFVCRSATDNELSFFLNQTRMSYFLACALGRRSNERSLPVDLQNDYILKSSYEDFVFFHGFHENIKHKQTLSIEFYIMKMLEHLERADDPVQTGWIKKFIFNEDLRGSIKKQDFTQKTVKTYFINSNQKLKIRLLDFLVETESVEDHIVDEILGFDLNKLSYTELTRLFRFLVHSKVRSLECARFALETLEKAMPISESANRKKYDITGYAGLFFDSSGNNLIKHILKTQDNFLKFCSKYKKFFIARSVHLAGLHLFESMEKYVTALEPHIGKKDIVEHLQAVLFNRVYIAGDNLDKKDYESLVRLYKRGYQLEFFAYKHLLKAEDCPLDVRDLFKDIPEVRDFLDLNVEFLNDLSSGFS